MSIQSGQKKRNIYQNNIPPNKKACQKTYSTTKKIKTVIYSFKQTKDIKKMIQDMKEQ